MPDIAQLGLSIDTRQVVEGSKALDSLGEAAVRVEQKTVGATAAVDKLGEASAGARAKATEGAAAVDALGDAGARVAPKVAGATASVDSLSAATARVRSTSTEGVSALDNFTNSSAGVWRRGGDAAKSVDALGDATQRTGQRAAISNGQMDDTSRIMRAQAEQARQAAQATQALGGTTTQLTLGQQQLIERMREQAATIGMSRTQLLAYQAAQMGVTKETQQAIATIKAHEDAIKAAAKAKEDATNASGILAGSLNILAAAYAALKVGEYVKDAVMLAARYETLGVVMTVVGRNAGYTKVQMQTATEAIAAQGITMTESRESAIKLVQAHVDLKHATALARGAQDAAVIGHINSSEAFDRMVNGIARGNVLILRNLGINVNLQTAYRQMADSLGKSTKELTENERVQARTGAVLERLADIHGTYTAAMDTASKQITSMQRYTKDLKTTLGEVGLEVLTVSVMALTKGLKEANGEVSDLSKNGQLAEWGHDLAHAFVIVADNVNNAFSAMKLMAAGASYLGNSLAITKQYGQDIYEAGFSVDAQVAAYQKQRAAVEANKQALAKERDDILAGEDKFQKAFDERAAIQRTKRKEEADATLKVTAEYSKAATDILMKSLNKGAAAQEEARKKVVALHYATFTGTPSYRDTEGREPKPKADQVENTQLADQIKQYAKEAATAKAHYDALGKLDDMYLKGGELSVQQAYENKRSYALKTYEAEVDAYDLQISALQGHNNTTKAEAAKHQKELNEILGKRDAAEKAFFDASFSRDEEERLRQAAIATAASDAANKEIAAINAQVAAVEEQIRTYGLLPAQKTALAVADLEEQKAALASFEGNERVIDGINRKIEAMKRLGIVQGKASTQEQGGYVAKAKELLDILTAVDTATKSAAQGMAASFGAVGAAIGGLTTALSGYAVQQQAIAAQLAASTREAYGDPTKIAKAQATAAQQGAQAQIKSYGDMTSAAKGFFKENSTGYKVMETTERAFRAYEMALAIESTMTKSGLLEAFTGLFVASKATETTVETGSTIKSVVNAGMQAAAWGVTAVVKAIASMPFPMNLVAGAATLAAVVAVGAKVVGGLGGGSASVSEQRQAANGTGTVLGDPTAKSESIAKSLSLIADNTFRDMSISSGMLRALRNIESGIGGLGGLLAQTPGVTNKLAAPQYSGLADFSAKTLSAFPLTAIVDKLTGGFLSKVSNSVVNGIFGGKVTALDTGITAGKATLGQVDKSGLSVGQFTDIKKDGGLFRKDKYSSPVTALGDEMDDQFTKIVLGLRDTVSAAADALGVGGDAFAAKLNSFVVDIGKVSFKGLDAKAQQEALEAAFSKMGDDMAKFGVDGLRRFRDAGEGYLETLVRVANDYATIDAVLGSFNKTFGAVGISSIAAREELLKLSGGLDNFTSQGAFFLENFFTDKEKADTLRKSVNTVLTPLNNGNAITSVEEFKKLALAQDLTTDAGQKTYTSMMAVSQAFIELTRYGDEFGVVAKTASEIDSERKDLQKQLNELTKSETELLAIQRAGIADVNRALFDQVQAARAVVSAKDALAKAYDTEAAAAKTVLDKSKSWVATLNGLNASMALGNQSILTPEQKYAEARSQFEKTLAAANAGDTTAQSGLSAAEQAFLTASQVVNASDAKYAADYARVLAANSEALKWASAQVDVQQASLDALKAQVSGLITINDSVLTVAQAIANLHAAMGTATGLGVQFDGSHAGGLANVPFDGYAAELHRGEVVVDAPAAAAMRRYFGGAPSQGGGNNDALVAEIKSLREEVKGLRADQAKQTGAAIQATVESNDKAAKTVVAGVDKSAKASAWAKQVEFSQ